jgi:hypothetical protein
MEKDLYHTMNTKNLTPEHLNIITQQYRTERLLPRLREFTQMRVQTGPFTDMLLLDRVGWGDGDLCGKLLGVYESELHDEIERVLAWQPDWVVNLGAAEGYYAVGMACRGCEVTAVEPQDALLQICRDTAAANGVRVGLRASLPLYQLEFLLQSRQRPVIVSDCEGAELEYLDLAQVPSLARTAMIVESHDVFRPGCTEILYQRFQATHHIRIMRPTGKDMWQWPELQDLWDIERLLIASELRPESARWMSLFPREVV